VIPYYDEGGITIYHGDCREILPSIEADVLVTDPPYGMAYASGWSGASIANDGDTAARDAALSTWGDRPALVFGRWSCPKPASTKTVLIWDKGDWPGMGDLKLPWGPSFEEVYVIGSGWQGPRRGSVIRDPHRPSGPTAFHPTQKPLAIMARLLESCPEGIILDPFMGSGTTLRAAKDLGRKAIGIEIEERYCEIAANRLAQEVLDLVA
jgi:DNA modification methylase